jgi:ditrans,polycis-polyprenyl diphosphate synthase
MSSVEYMDSIESLKNKEVLNCLEKTICSILKAGELPSHIGFIMDGNRRYAKKLKLKSTLEGHALGLRALKKCILICGELDIKEVSLFCFSVENFNRSEEEVSSLMELFIETFHEMSSMSELLVRFKAR